MVLRHQLFDMGQHQHAARASGKLGDHQTLPAPVGRTIAAGSVWRRNREGGIDGFLLVRT